MNAIPRLDLVLVDWPKFPKEQHQLETLTYQWIYFMKYARSLTSVTEIMDSVPEIHQAFDIANQVNLSREEVEDLDRIEQFIDDQQGQIIKASQSGREEGREEGKREEKLAIARQLLSRLDNDTISQVTGLTVEDVQNLREAKLSRRESDDS
ncbi:MAG: Rpn family recombination-promoting nuclease/putative transposase [Microcoleus sp.]